MAAYIDNIFSKPNPKIPFKSSFPIMLKNCKKVPLAFFFVSPPFNKTTTLIHLIN